VTGLAAGLAAFRVTPTGLAEPAACPGLLEWAMVVASRSAADVPIATSLLGSYRAAAFATLVLYAALLRSLSVRPVAVAGAMAALVASPLLQPVLAPAPAMAAAVAVGALLMIGRARGPDGRPRRVAGACIGIGFSAAVAPASTVPAGIAAAAMVWQATAGRPRMARLTSALATALGVVTMSLAAVAAVPQISPRAVENVARACMVAWPLSAADGARAMLAGVSALAPLVVGLALLGLFAGRHRLRASTSWPAILFVMGPVLSLVWFQGSDLDTARVLAPTMIGVWCLVAVGLNDVDAALATPWSRLVVGVLLALALPWQQSATSASASASAAPDAGHVSLTRQQFSALVSALPEGSVLIVEDAITDILARDVVGRLQRRGKRLAMVARDPDEVAAALHSGPTFALPAAQVTLQRLGFVLTRAGDELPGLARVARRGDCETVPGHWTRLASWTGTGFSAIAAARDAPWHIVAYVGGAAPLKAHPDHWQARPGLGFHARDYDLTLDTDRLRLGADLAIDRPSSDEPPFKGRHVSRVEVWRAAGAPDVVPVAFSDVADAWLIRARRSPGDTTVAVCMTTPFAALALVPGGG